MRRVSTVLGAALVVALVASGAYAQRADQPKVTGGGQIVLATDPPTVPEEAEDTIAFSAIGSRNGNSNAATGQVQYVPTATQSGQVADGWWHGFVTCLIVESDTTAIFAGDVVAGDGAGEEFEIRVVDNGTPGDGTDLITLRKPATSGDCDDTDENGTEHELARGNLVVHNPNP